MPNVNIDDARYFLESNISFFTTPLDDQEAFRKYFEKDGTRTDIEHYSNQLIEILNEPLCTFGKYTAPALVFWENKNFELALKHRKVQEFIINNAKHPAILSWQSAHPALDIEKKKTLINNNEKKYMSKSIQEMHGILIQAVKTLNIAKTALCNSSISTNTNAEDIDATIAFIRKRQLVLQLIKMELLEDDEKYKITNLKQSIETLQRQLISTAKSHLLNESQPNQIKLWTKKFISVIIKKFKIHCDEKGNINALNLPQHSMFLANRTSAEIKFSKLFQPPKETENPDITP